MQSEEINRYVGKFVRIYQKDGATFWTGSIESVSAAATTIIDKFGRFVTVENSEIKTISEWG